MVAVQAIGLTVPTGLRYAEPNVRNRCNLIVSNSEKDCGRGNPPPQRGV